MSRASATRLTSSSNGVTHDLSCLISWTTVRARSWFDQNPGSPCSASSSFSRAWRLGRSKKTPQFVGPLADRLDSISHCRHVRPRWVRGARKQKA